ncbi:hypothetical protein Tco_0697020 [Tanacetum coccineum]
MNKGEYDIWAMKMEHYLRHTDYPIWEVIQKGNGSVQVLTDTNGQIRVLPPKTAKEILPRERERKARTTLLIFGGNDESKKMQKYILKQLFESFSVSNSEGLHKGYDRFQSLLSQLEIHGASVSTEAANQKFLRVFESDVKGTTTSSSSTQNVAFVSSESPSNTNDVSTAYSVSTSSGHNSQKKGSSSYTDELKHNLSSQATTTSTARKVNTARPIDAPQKALKNKGIVDSGCSRHMTGNKAYLVEYQNYNGGPVAFGGSKDTITGKGKIITGKLDFEDVYFVKELKQFNLFYMSQMCDKKNKVLFIDSECLVLSPDFKFPDEN